MPRKSGLTIAARVLLLPYLVALSLIVWLPAKSASQVTGIAFAFARFVSDSTGLSLATSNSIFEFLANIALFVPFGLLLAVARPRMNLWWIVLLGFCISAIVELVQTMLPTRYATVSDVVANTLGAVAGGVLIRVSIAARIRSAPRSL